jgi:hypothetical protein
MSKHLRCSCYVTVVVVALAGTLIAQDETKKDDSSSPPKSTETQELPLKLSDELKTLIDQEVKRRVQEALEAALQDKPPQQPVTPAQIEELNRKVDEVIEANKKVRPSEFNPAIGLVGETIFSYRNRDSSQTPQGGSNQPGGFDVFQRSVELNIAAAVDPFFRGYAVLNASADAKTGEALVDVEEAALVSTSLPLNLTLQAGRFFAEIGRLEYIHDHELPFVNRPLPLEQYVGGESRTDGIQLNWLVPVDHYISITAGLGDGMGGDVAPSDPGGLVPFGKRGPNALTFWGRASTYFDLTDDWQLETGISGLLGPREKGRGDDVVLENGAIAEEIYRSLLIWDLKVAYVPLQNNQFSGLTFGMELLFSSNRYRNDPDIAPDSGDESGDTSVSSVGSYAYVTYKWDRQWSGGVLWEYVEDIANNHEKTAAYSAYITWATSHWNQIRLQFTRTEENRVAREAGLKDDNAIYIQWAWIIGAHSHGWTQR